MKEGERGMKFKMRNGDPRPPRSGTGDRDLETLKVPLFLSGAYLAPKQNNYKLLEDHTDLMHRFHTSSIPIHLKMRHLAAMKYQYGIRSTLTVSAEYLRIP